jgi:spore coat polysaccharide biosynthesis predicted glycosyltransferase SpsG
MKNKDLAIQNYKRFCELEGSDYIASEFALESILKIIKIFNVASILELGLGIGSISDTVLKYSKKENKNISYAGTEDNEFCLDALKKNVYDYVQIELYPELNQIKNKKFDLIIIDGYDDTLLGIIGFCKKNTIVFIEGDRKGQTETIMRIFPKNKYVNVITLDKNKSYSHGGGDTNRYVGGGKLIFIDPTFKMNLFWFQQKVATFIKNKIRIYREK